ncbi:MAG: ABC transporter ATP-binding protein [Cyanobacteriota bacterium]|nr:ABC transporter ATP-binding protein [Cyanobacteriota bacterium]
MTLTLDRITKTFDNGVVALEETSLTVAPGEFVSFVGPSGCGKSTLLRIVAGLTAPSTGRMDWGAGGEPPDLAFVFQEPALMPWATVTDNLRLPLRLAGLPPHQAQPAIADALRLVGLEGFPQAYPRQLSGGMKMRASIARALVTNPQVLLMDEPFGALDDITRTQLNEDLLALWIEHRWTVLFVTHNIYEAVLLSSRVVVMSPRPGRITADVAIASPQPRSPSFRHSPAYPDYCQQVAAALVAAMARGDASPAHSP